MLILLNLLRKELILLLLLSFGVGAEIYLIGFQITNEVYCYYCLAFEAIIALLFLVNYPSLKERASWFSEVS